MTSKQTVKRDEQQRFVGHWPRDCRVHETTGNRARCLDCNEWCSELAPCVGCEAWAVRRRVGTSDLTELAELAERTQGLERKLAKVAGMHAADTSNALGPWCPICEVPWPCQTRSLLDGEEQQQ